MTAITVPFISWSRQPEPQAIYRGWRCRIDSAILYVLRRRLTYEAESIRRGAEELL